MVATRDVTDAATGAPDDAAAIEPEPRDRWDRVLTWVGIAVVAACCLYVFFQLQPRLLFLNTTPTGGDTGAHVWFPAYLRDHLLPHWRLAGWTDASYAGFPAGQFYFPFPALLIVGLDVVLPYNIAFKLVTALGPVLLPIAAYVFGRGLKVPRPAAPLMAVAATAFLFFTDGGDATMRFDHHIMGGTITSTLAGEYSFTIAVACALFFLGTLAMALDTRRRLWLPAAFLAATLTSHLVVGVFACYGALVIWLFRRPIKNLTRTAAIGAVGVTLTAVWLVPLAATLGYTTDMRYEPVGTGYTDPWLLGRLGIRLPVAFDWMFLSEHWYLFVLALVAIGGGIAYRRRATLELGLIAFLAGATFCGWEVLRDIFGKAPAWNLRLLPFWYITLYLLAAVGAAELARWIGHFAAWIAYGPAEGSDQRARTPRNIRVVRILAVAVTAVIFTTIALARVQATRDYIPYWAKYNYTGYEGGSVADATKKDYAEYRAFIDAADALPPGRMLWEPTSDIGRYGTPLALMLLPYWTDGRIGSMEGLYYESAGTTDYHFLTAATLTPTPSNPVRGLPYRTNADFDLGVRYLQLLGVRYYAATKDMEPAADQNPALRLVATVPDVDPGPPEGWKIYEVADSPVVAPLRYEPVVATGLHADPNWKCEGNPKPAAGAPGVDEFSPWECLSVPWFNDPSALDRPLAADGPASWRRADMASARDVTKRRLPGVQVSNIRTTDTSIDFDVSRTGVPVMVKTSYFPNWQAEGANGPWRATPNFMVVVPTSRHVHLTYGTTTAEWVGRVGTVVGLVGLGGLVWWGIAGGSAAADDPDRRGRSKRSRHPRRSGAAPGAGDGDGDGPGADPEPPAPEPGTGGAEVPVQA
ncbi:MAG TPA: 6-pyruvoyl-tetrahydropterin synthase-related protein [Acidimicrobiia bacterium]